MLISQQHIFLIKEMHKQEAGNVDFVNVDLKSYYNFLTCKLSDFTKVNSAQNINRTHSFIHKNGV